MLTRVAAWAIIDRKMRRYFLLLFLLLETASARGGGIHLWPLYNTEEEDEGTLAKYETDVVWPLYHYAEEDGTRDYQLRPLFGWTRDERKQDTEAVFLWPVFRYGRNPAKRQGWILPVFYYKSLKHVDTGFDRDWFVFPILWGGKSRPAGSYFAVFPVAGKVEGLFGKDRIRFVLFPLYWDTKDGEFLSANFLWPFFSFGQGAQRSAFSFWPWYGSSDKEKHFSRRYYLWPLVHVQDNNLHKRYPQRLVMVWPFYGFAESQDSLMQTVAWPFFSTVKDRRHGYVEYNLPWPVIKFARGKDLLTWRYWPFYGRSRTKKYDSRFYLFPLGWNYHYRQEKKDAYNYYFLPFFWQFRTRYQDPPRSKNFVKFWPLVDYFRDEAGGVTVSLLSLLWFKDHHPEGFEKLYAPWWTIYSERPIGDKQITRILYPLYVRRESPQRSYWRCLFLSRESRGVGERRTSFLHGMLEWGEEGGRNYLQLLWLPRISWGSPEA